MNLKNTITNDMATHFFSRTNRHIDVVGKYIDKIIKKIPFTDGEKHILQLEKMVHDSSKFDDPEIDPYILITWKYKMRDTGKDVGMYSKFDNMMTSATIHHVKHNRHHPEYWSPQTDVINEKDRDKPAGLIDATKMPLVYTAVMVADWMAVSEERKQDPYKWAHDNIDKRWKFNDAQKSLIYFILDKVWNQ